jgi:GNAT superfamily N-acetyltransferase
VFDRRHGQERAMQWIHESPPRWDDTKAAILGAARGIFGGFDGQRPGDLISGEWWRVEEAGDVVGYGWLDHTWGDAEILLAVAPQARGHGVGTFILDRLEREAAARGLNYMFNVVPKAHPDPDRFARWLASRGFEPAHDDLYRRRVRPPAASS